MATFECGLCGRVSNASACHCWRHESVHFVLAITLASGGQVYVDPSLEWTDELIRLCSRTDGHPNEYRYDIHEHLGKRGEQ